MVTYDEMHAVAQYLYQLLDDIDTAGDIAKADDVFYRKIVERTQTKKGAVVAECNGYTVTLRPLPSNAKVSGAGTASDGLPGYAAKGKNDE